MANFLGLNYPIIANNPKGYFQQVSGNDTIKADLLILLQTNQTERVMLPNFGTGLNRLLFEQNNQVVETEATNRINTAISTWERRVAISQLTATSGVTRDLADPSQSALDPVLTIQASFSQFDSLQSVDNLTLELPL